MRLAVAGALLAVIGRLLRTGSLTFVGQPVNPLGVTNLGLLPALVQISGFVALGVAAVATGVSLMLRYSGGDRTERAQLRVYTALGVVQSGAFALLIAPIPFPQLNNFMREPILILNLLVFAVGPVAPALAIARYRLYEIDQLVGRTFVYGALTAILAGLFAASLKFFEDLFTAATGLGSDAALVLTTLVLVAMFTPIKNRLDAMVARWMGQPVHGAMPSALPAAVDYDPRDDPNFGALVDARIYAVLDRRDQGRHRDGDTNQDPSRDREQARDRDLDADQAVEPGESRS
jgi:hypothetical protein